MSHSVYCDIDGVLHRWPCPQEEMFDAGCIARLTNVLRMNDTQLIVTSTWRLSWPLKEIQQRLGTLGSYLIGVTPEIDDPFAMHARYQEVLLHQKLSGLPDSHWIAIDDESGRYPPLDNIILTNPRIGFSDADAARLTRLLGYL